MLLINFISEEVSNIWLKRWKMSWTYCFVGRFFERLFFNYTIEVEYNYYEKKV